MNITLEKQENCQALLRVEIPSETVTSERADIVKAFSRQARLPGFRPGKAPRKVIEKRYAREIGEELQSRLIRQGFQEAVEKESLKVLSAPDPGDPTHHSDGSFTFTSNLVLAPDFELPDYKALTIEVPDRKVEDSDLDIELEKLRDRFAEFEAEQTTIVGITVDAPAINADLRRQCRLPFDILSDAEQALITAWKLRNAREDARACRRSDGDRRSRVPSC